MSILFTVHVNASPEPFQSFCLTEAVEVAEFSCEKLLEFGKFGFWIYETLVSLEFNGMLGFFSPGTQLKQPTVTFLWHLYVLYTDN